jgi:uncharacterized phage protein gp47/JayE
VYETINYELILQRMLDRISDRLDKREGSVIWDSLSPTAIELQILYIELDVLLREGYGDTASREYLIKRCKERGIAPYPATNAIMQGNFTPTSLDVTGKRFSLGELNYIVIEKIFDGSYQVKCEEQGTVGNKYLGPLIPIEYIPGLQSAELTSLLIPGEDEEDTEHLRERYFASFDVSAFGGNVWDYLEKTNAIAGVGDTKVTPVWNGNISPAGMIPSDTVKAWYEETIATLPADVAAWLIPVFTAANEKKLTVGGTVHLTILNSDYLPASEILIQTVQEAMDPETYGGEGKGIAPIGHLVSVDTAEPVTVDIETNITFDSGFSWTNLQQTINEKVEGYFSELRKEWAHNERLTVRISQIETRMLGITGILDIADTRLNGIADNLILGAYEIPVKGAVSQ